MSSYNKLLRNTFFDNAVGFFFDKNDVKFRLFIIFYQLENFPFDKKTWNTSGYSIAPRVSETNLALSTNLFT